MIKRKICLKLKLYIFMLSKSDPVLFPLMDSFYNGTPPLDGTVAWSRQRPFGNH